MFFLGPVCLSYRPVALQQCFFSQKLEKKYTDPQKEKIMKVMNESNADVLAGQRNRKKKLVIQSCFCGCVAFTTFELWGVRAQISLVIVGINETNAVKLYGAVLLLVSMFFLGPVCLSYRPVALQQCFFSQKLEKKYTDPQKEKIMKVMNESNADVLAGYEITKGRLRKFIQWKESNGKVNTLSDIELVESFSEKTAEKLFNSILNGPVIKDKHLTRKIKGQFLQPYLSEAERQSCKTVMSLFIAVNSICWTLIDRSNYEVIKWQYHNIEYPNEKRMQITDIMDIAWKVTQSLPTADIYVMKAEATTLRAAGSDPNNPKVIAVNLQKAQMVAMIVALINARSFSESVQEEESDLKQKVYFLRPTLPYRLYGTLVGNEKVSTDQTVEMLLQESTERSSNNAHVHVPETLRSMFRAQKDLQKDMLGHSLLLALTFMDLCIYKNQEKINKLISNREE